MQLSPKTFRYQGKNLEYFDHPHHETYLCERRIEIPIGLDFLTKFKGKKVLEVGNVLSYYYPPGITNMVWDIVDKYEVVPEHGVINEDILTFKPTGEKYDAVLSLSTMEHVGFEQEYPGERNDFRKGIEATKNLQENCLKKGGWLMITFPWGYNATFVMGVLDGELGFQTIHFMKRITSDNQWRQVGDRESFNNIHYNYPFYAGCGLIIAYYEKT